MKEICVVVGCSRPLFADRRCEHHFYPTGGPPPRDCVVCGVRFYPRNPNTQTCNDSCMSKLVHQKRGRLDAGFQRQSCTAEGCDRKRHSQGLCRMHWDRFRNHGSPDALRRRRPAGMSVYDWFMSYVDKTGECWVWQGNVNKNRNGYGMFYDSGQRKKIFAHHFLVPPVPSREEANGVKMEYDHTCRNVRCVRPEHLELVTATENRLRENAVRWAKTKEERCESS